MSKLKRHVVRSFGPPRRLSRREAGPGDHFFTALRDRSPDAPADLTGTAAALGGGWPCAGALSTLRASG